MKVLRYAVGLLRVGARVAASPKRLLARSKPNERYDLDDYNGAALHTAGLAVPINTLYAQFKRRGPVRLKVCSEGFLYAQAQRAANAWNNALGIKLVEVSLGGCDSDPRQANGISECYYKELSTNSHTGRQTAGYWKPVFGDGRVVEDDVQVDTGLDNDSVYPVLLHEIGHALGLAHAHPGERCEYSVMLPMLCDRWTEPTPNDIASVRYIYGLGHSTGVRKYDVDGDGKLSDSEFFRAVDDWIASIISNSDFFKLVDWWVSGELDA